MLPDRAQVTMTVPFMRAYTELLVKTCHRHGAHAIGGMAAYIPSRRDPEVNERALAKVREDKERESGDGFDGTWVAHPDLVPVAWEAFERVMGDKPNQKERLREDVQMTDKDLVNIQVPGGQITEAGVRLNVNVALQYLNAWLDGMGGYFPFDITNSASPARFDQPKIDNKSRAVYTQWTVEPLQFLHVTGGIRYTWEEKELTRFEPGFMGHRSETFSKWTPMGSASLVAPEPWLDAIRGDSAILYYTYAEGFKSGGFNEIQDVSTGDPVPGFKEEELTSHEVGLKLGFLENRLLLNTALFYNEYEDLQLTVIRVSGDGTQIGSSITNAGEATIKGFEVELVAQPVQGLQANASVGYLDAEYDEFFDTVPGMPGVLQDRSDEPFFNVPEWSVSAGVQYKFELDGLFDGRDLGSLTPRFDFSYKSKRAYHLTRAGFESGLF
jgi:outer membrane receptor protein involved in Fe transport